MTPPASDRPKEPIAIIGSGFRFPGGANNPTQLWDLLRQPRDVQSPIPADRFSLDGFYHPSHDHQGTSHTRHGYFLSGDHRQFDAEFFGIKPVEANSMDPQQRLLLEVVYESIEAAGLNLEALRGSPTAVYVGLMAVDYADMLNRDTSDYPPYVAPGTARSMMSNRVSYFFDWRGPSMTIDTACSSSLVAVHLAIQSLRAGESKLAIAAGANLLLGPEQFIAGSHMKMLSPNGRSFWCDDRANGYARGEGIAAIVLKTLSAAIADGDDIECVIAETGLNQDGRTQGLTVPSAVAQATLIETTYRKAGLDVTKLSDRPQYFEAHGAGTPTGDPIEVKAIHDAFFANVEVSNIKDHLYCGSVKTIIGHTEGTAGLAGLIKTALALRYGIIPPNLLFESLAPAVKPFYNNLKIPTTARPWPTLTPGSVRRASVNCFGFGGTNAHCILESYSPAKRGEITELVSHLPFVFSAISKKSLFAMLKSYWEYLDAEPTIDLRALSHTLCTRRTAFPVRVTFSAKSLSDLCTKLVSFIDQAGAKPALTAPTSASRARILGIFTGQGAQWAGMASRLMRYPAAVAIIDELERSLADLPDPPSWSLKAELSVGKSCSRITEAAIAQPACTAVQILLVKMLQAADVRFSAVVGHSSGEIAAAYAAGYLSARDAIRVAYYRGVHLPLVGGKNGETGAMIAIDASYEEAQSICNRDEFCGRICVAASNSASSVTLSGDALAIRDVQAMFKASKRFARLLKVDNAYHSHHMLHCSEAITASLSACKIDSQRPASPDCLWVSSVYHRDIALVVDSLDDHYWHSNTVGEVLFSQALENALQQSHFDLAVEIGAHPALKGPALQVIEDTIGHTIPYTGTLSRSAEDDEAFVSSLSYIWANLTKSIVNFAGFDRFVNASDPPMLLKGLPLYPWDHERAFWHESRLSLAYRNRSSRHELLGLRNADYAEDQLSWKNSLVPEKLSWVSDHRIQGQMIFPGAAYIVSAFEAARQVAGEQPVELIELTNFVFGQPLVFAAEDSRVEVLISLNDIRRRKSNTTANFTYHSIANRAPSLLTLNAHCQLSIVYGKQDENILRPLAETQFGMTEIDSERIYESFAKYGYQYTGLFRSLGSVTRKLGVASGLVRMPDPTSVTRLSIHPATLDAAIHSILVAHSYPDDGRLSTPLLPTEVLRISLHLSGALESQSHQHLKFTSFSIDDGKRTEGKMELFSVESADTILRLEGLHTKPMVPATPANDVHMFSETVWGPAYPLSQENRNGFDAMKTSSRKVDHLMVSAAEQLSHRYPSMHILGIGAGLPNDTMRFLSGLNNAFASYTHTEVSDEGLVLAGIIIDSLNDKIKSRKLNPEINVSDQGFAKQSFDLVVAFSISPKRKELQQTLENVRHLLKPGGYFLCSHSVDYDLLTRSSSSNPVSGPRVCGDSRRPSSTLESLSQRKRIHETYGFANIDPPSQTRNDSLHHDHSRVTLIQAIDDRILFLRDPLKQAAQYPPISAGDITLIGGGTLATSACASKIVESLTAYSDKVTRVNSFSSLLDTKIRSGGSVLLLQDHDKPLFEDFNHVVLEGLQKLFGSSKNVLWVTHGYKRNTPHARMLVAFARCLVQEMAHVRLQILDLPSPDALDASLVSQDFLRLLGTGGWEEQGLLNGILWSVEPEISYEEGCMFIPRVRPSRTLNDRYNSVRRTIIGNIDPYEETVTISTEDDTYVLRAKIGASQPPIETNHITIRVIHSFLKTVKIERCGFFYLLLGTNVMSDEQVIALSSTLSSKVDVPKELVRSCSLPRGKAVEHLHAVFCGLISTTILRGLVPDDSVLVSELDTDIATILPTFAAAQGIRVIFSMAAEVQNVGLQTRLRAFRREVNAALHNTNLSRVICWKDDEWITKACDEIPISNPFQGLRAYVATESSPVNCSSTVRASAALDSVLDRLISTTSTTASKAARILLTNVTGSSTGVDPMTMVEWTTKSKVPVRIEPVDYAELFQCDKTYWLVGLTGSLGLSLCQWMISRGARHIALSSRYPKVDSAWLAHFHSLGATVKVLIGDVTDYQSVESTLGSITASMPTVAGVCHGAMVLQDALIHDLDMPRVEQVLKPKVNGAVHLDTVFRNQKLDFFVMLSSIAAITGNPGQAMYAAANGFLAGLTAQRRARGDCASTVNMGAIIGTGATRSLTLAQQKSLQKAGVMWTSEQDFHSAFAEAVVASSPGSGSSGEITTGVRICRADEPNKPKHTNSPVFSHTLLQRNAIVESTAMNLPAESVRAQLLRATTEQMVSRVLENFLTSKLQQALQMSPDSTVVDKTADSLGIDSLIAIEMRSWLLKELSVDLPLLTIIGGSNMRHVIEVCRSLLNPAIVPLLKADPTTSTENEARLSQNNSKPIVTDDGQAQVSAALSSSTAQTWIPSLRTEPMTKSDIEQIIVSPNRALTASMYECVDKQTMHAAPIPPDVSEPIVIVAEQVPPGSSPAGADIESCPLHDRETKIREIGASIATSCIQDDNNRFNVQDNLEGTVIGVCNVPDELPQPHVATHRRRLLTRVLQSRRFARFLQWR